MCPSIAACGMTAGNACVCHLIQMACATLMLRMVNVHRDSNRGICYPAKQMHFVHCQESGALCRGFTSLAAAAEDALAALGAARGPAWQAAPALQVAREGQVRHTPDLARWREALGEVQDSLAPSCSEENGSEVHYSANMLAQALHYEYCLSQHACTSCSRLSLLQHSKEAGHDLLV